MSNNNFLNRIYNGTSLRGKYAKTENNIRNTSDTSRNFKRFAGSNLTVYPEQAADQQHFIIFDILERGPATTTLPGTAGPGSSAIGTGDVQKIIQGKTNFLGNGFAGSSAKRRVVQTIALYMPQTLSFTTKVNYGEMEAGLFTGAFLKIKNEMAKKEGVLEKLGAIIPAKEDIAKYIPNETARAVFQKTTNTAPAAYKDVLFEGIDYRNFSFTFKFTPRNPAETEMVEKICNTFKYHSLPSSKSGEGGPISAYNLPEEFVIRFYYKTAPNKYIDSIGLCALQEVGVNYGGDKFSTHKDGSPVTTELTLSFRELELIDKQRHRQLRRLRDGN